MWAAGGLMRDVCFPKFPKVTKEIADGIRAGNLPNDKDAKCYVNCILEMMQTVRIMMIMNLRKSLEDYITYCFH